MIKDIQDASKIIGITTVYTNSTEKIETQLLRIPSSDLPIMLISWDIETTIDFDSSGFLNNPVSNITCLLMTKAENLSKIEMENSAEEMGVLFQNFIIELNKILKLKMRDQTQSLGAINYKLIPAHGTSKHSGVLGNFTMKLPIENCN